MFLPHFDVFCYMYLLGSLSKARQRRQRERHQTKGLMSKTIAVHVRYKSLYISLPSSAKQQREMTKFCVVYGTCGRRWLIFVFPFGIERRRCVLNLSTFLEPLAYQTDQDNREFRF